MYDNEVEYDDEDLYEEIDVDDPDFEEYMEEQYQLFLDYNSNSNVEYY